MRSKHTTLRHGPAGIALLLALLPGESRATMLEQLDTRQLALAARSIYVGKVSRQWSAFDPDARMVFTYSKLQVEKTVKGASAKEILLRQPGGEAGEIGMIVHGTARFAPKERVLVFLQEERGGARALVGMAQGKFSVTTDLATGQETAVFEPPANLEFVHRGLLTHPGPTRVPLVRLLKEIRGYLAEEAPMDP